ncbi:L-threonine 3-dehydrogenase [Octopus bimaculoides]|uniref:Enoyl reductase (ER) domain-containing protein n=1 Tax=Octopus bimaculoides TaxID=37653 RepID=A0A0L8HZG2_OCTBM|nr:L-threonine 3-dehydrogenase [Octopus bimaculoides]|eukprot:XP_014768421.1 PREDICTED: L-threonine 3-dehydrogenase-like [Octopus bimaculoides]
MADPLPRKMEALVKTSEKESFEFKTLDLPEPVGDEALIKIEVASLCGSDINLYKWNEVAKLLANIPFTPGHECAGTVVKCGPSSTVIIGQRVTVENHFFCDHCYQCKHGLQGICKNMGQYGHGNKTIYGGCSQYSIVPSKYLYCLKTNISFLEATLLEPLGVSHQAIESLEVQNEDVLIIGCGAIGLLATSVAKALGANRVICTDVIDERLQLAKKMGADVTVNSSNQDLKNFIMNLTNDDGINRICECSGSTIMVNSMFGMLRKGGHIVMVGLPKEPIHIENTVQDILFKSLTLKTVHGRRIFHTWECCEMLVFSGQVDVKPLITHKFPMREFEEAFKTIFSGKCVKAIIEP